MSTYNTGAFLRIVRENGCDMAFTGLLSARGLLTPDSKTGSMLEAPPDGLELVVQLFGADPLAIATAAEIIEKWGKAIAIDINMGCPMKKVFRTGAGVSIMKNTELAAAIVAETSRRVRLPVTVKIRSGWSGDEINAIEVAAACERAGASAVTLHPRTCAQGFKGSADWKLIKLMKDAVKIPVIGSGDIVSPEDVQLMREETGCDSVMIGRAALNDPTLIGRSALFMRTGEIQPNPSNEEKMKLLLRHLEFEVENSGEKRGVRRMRKFFSSYTRRMRGSAEMRNNLMKSKEIKDVEETIRNYLAGNTDG